MVRTRTEVQAILAYLENPWNLAAQLMHGSGLRLMEALRLRVKDIESGQATITVHRLESGIDIRTVQDLLGHTDVSTAIIYLHVMKCPGAC